ncbi:hypothetical protein B14911_06041 [Bacillus sp. NRRL B-14911]|nr:hypothetical protein B14911_06041 [Bacillus sp. NRRL B-14911]
MMKGLFYENIISGKQVLSIIEKMLIIHFLTIK